VHAAIALNRLQQLGQLREQGILSDAEFEQEKARILGEPKPGLAVPGVICGAADASGA